MVDTSHRECHSKRIRVILAAAPKDRPSDGWWWWWRTKEHTSRSSAVGAETTCCKRSWTWAKCRVNAASEALKRSCSSSSRCRSTNSSDAGSLKTSLRLRSVVSEFSFSWSMPPIGVKRPVWRGVSSIHSLSMCFFSIIIIIRSSKSDFILFSLLQIDPINDEQASMIFFSLSFKNEWIEFRSQTELDVTESWLRRDLFLLIFFEFQRRTKRFSNDIELNATLHRVSIEMNQFRWIFLHCCCRCGGCMSR